MSEPFEDEMLRRARRLVENRGEREIRLDKAYDVPFKVFKTDRLSLAIDSRNDRLSVAMTFAGISGSWLIYYVAQPHNESIFRPEHYEKCAELMRSLMLLEDLANV